jgi:hypothetical protein
LKLTQKEKFQELTNVLFLTQAKTRERRGWGISQMRRRGKRWDLLYPFRKCKPERAVEGRVAVGAEVFWWTDLTVFRGA